MLVKMNKKGQVIFFTLMLAIVIIILALAFAPVIRQFVDEARQPSSDTQIGLDCNNPGISDFDKANCVAIDFYNPYFIGMLIGVAGAIIGARVLYGG